MHWITGLAFAALAGPLDAPTAEDVAAALEQAAAYLLERQERYTDDPPIGRLPQTELGTWQAGEAKRLAAARAADGPGVEWPYEGVYRVQPRGAIPPGYRVGGTAIACEALIAAPGYAESEPRRAAVERATRFMLDLLESDERLAPGPKQGYDVRGWGHTYALRFFLLAADAGALDDAELAARTHATVPHLIECLAVNEIDGGGWNYAGGSPSPFMTASTLLALFHADARGFEVDDTLIARALDALERGRASNAAFAYSGKTDGTEPMPGSAARSAAAELVLFLGGRSTDESLHAAVSGFFEGWQDLLARKSKQGTHEGPFAIAPYYFFYGHAYAALAIEYLPEPARAELRGKQRELLWKTREQDGSWNDRIFPRTSSYGTAMAMLALLAPDLPRVPAWSDKNEPGPAEAETKDSR